MNISLSAPVAAESPWLSLARLAAHDAGAGCGDLPGPVACAMAKVLAAVEERVLDVPLSTDDETALAKAVQFVQVSPGDDAPITKPLVVHGPPSRRAVSCGRHFHLRRKVGKWIGARALASRACGPAMPTLDPQLLEGLGLDQKLALAFAAWRSFAILTGGPGTGKTTTVARLLAARMSSDGGLCGDSVLLLAPTGKASARLAESLADACAALRGLGVAPSVVERIRSITPSTLHRALRWSPQPPEKGGPFTFNAANPLPHRLILVDECSMVDLALFADLIDAVPDCAHVILMGDRHQLDSVEVGGVLSQLVQRAGDGRHPAASLDALASACGVDPKDPEAQAHLWTGGAAGSRADLLGAAFTLRKTHRYAADSGLGKADQKVRRRLEAGMDDGPGALAAALEGIGQDARVAADGRARPPKKGGGGLLRLFSQSYLPLKAATQALHAHSAPEAFSPVFSKGGALQSFAVLCAMRRGPSGADAWNEALMEAWLGCMPRPGQVPAGVPVMVTRNHHGLRLYNGDVGVAVASEAGGVYATHAVFPGEGGAPHAARIFPLALLPGYGPALALTIHQSQGSEWNKIAIILPAAFDRPSGVGSRHEFLDARMLYTALTRSRAGVEVAGG